MASKTDEPKKRRARYSIVERNGHKYYKVTRRIGDKLNKNGVWVPNYQPFYGKTLKEAEAKAKAAASKQNTSDECFGAVLDKWIENVFRIDAKHTTSTKNRYINAYEFALKGLPILGRKLTDLTALDLQAEYNNMTCGASTVKACHKLLRLFFAYCEKNNICKDISHSMALPAVKKRNESQEIDVLSDQEISEILDGFKSHRLYLLILLALNTGARIGELLALRYDDITKDGIKINKQLTKTQEIEKPKTASGVRIVPIKDSTRAAIKDHKAWHKAEMLANGYRTEYIFTTSTGEFYFDPSIRKACNRVYDRIGVRRVGFTVYRHTFGSRLANAGVPIQTVADLMGHSDVSVTGKYYINVSTDVKKAAINALPF